MSSEQTGDEINLIELIGILWDAKWLITGITSAFAAISFACTLLIPSSFEGNIRISALSNQQMAAYQILNDTPGISPPIYAGETLVGHVGVFSREDFFTNFVDHIRQGTIFVRAHKRLDPEFKNFDGTDVDLIQALAKTSNLYVFTPDKRSETGGVLSFETVDRELATTIVKTALNEAQNIARADSLAAISNLRLAINKNLAFELENVNLKIQNALANYETELIARRAILAEQAAIARQLGNANGLAITSGNNGINVAVEQEQPLYMRGYKALDKEIALIDARGKGQAALPFVEDYILLAAEKRKLESDMRLARIDSSLAETPLVDKNRFRPANYDFEAMTFDATVSKSLIVILAALIGGLMTAIFVLIRGSLTIRGETRVI